MATWKDLTKFERFVLRVKECEMFFLWGGITSSAFFLTLSLAQIMIDKYLGPPAVIPAAIWLFFIVFCLISSPYGDRVKRKLKDHEISKASDFIEFVDEDQNLEDYEFMISLIGLHVKSKMVFTEIRFQVPKVKSTQIAFCFTLPYEYFNDYGSFLPVHVCYDKEVLYRIYDAILMESL